MNAIRVQPIPLNLIDKGERLRPVDADWVGILAASIQERGLDTPIQLRETDETEKSGRYRLVSGAHRLAAFQALGRTSIPAAIVDMDELGARLAEIDENLMRRELSDLDRAVFMLERKRVWETLHPRTKHGGKRGADQVANLGDLTARFSRDAARKLGRSERGIQRIVQRAERLPAHVRRMIGGTRVAESGAELDRLIRVPAHLLESVAELLRDGQAPTVARALVLAIGEAPAAPETAAEADARQLQKLQRAWSTAGSAARGAFLEWLKGGQEGE